MGITETGITNGVPLHPFSLGVIVKFMMSLGHMILVNGAKILPPIARLVPNCPSEEVQSKVVPA